jgi:small subunit ribosomal protein S6
VLREYEVTSILSAQITDSESKKLQEKYEDVLLANGGEIIKKNDWGVKKLAFPMKGQYRGHYVHYDLTSSPANLAEAERLMRIDDNVLRYLSVKVSDTVNVEERKAELAKAEARAVIQKEASH